MASVLASHHPCPASLTFRSSAAEQRGVASSRVPRARPTAVRRATRKTTTSTRAFLNKKGPEAKAKPTAPMSGRNLIKPKPLYAPGEEPWYIDPKTGKAPGYLQLVFFMASQLFIGQVMVPVSIWWQQLFDPIINK